MAGRSPGWIKGQRWMDFRLRDYKNPAIEALEHIPSYTIDPAYLVEAKLKHFDKPKTITVNSPFQDYTQDYLCPGESPLHKGGGR